MQEITIIGTIKSFNQITSIKVKYDPSSCKGTKLAAWYKFKLNIKIQGSASDACKPQGKKLSQF